MAVESGKDGQVKVGATSTTAVGRVVSWTLNWNAEEFVSSSLGIAYKQRDVGQTDWTVVLEVDLDESDTVLASLLILGAAVTLFLYTDNTSPKGRTGAGVVISQAITVAGTANNHVTVNIGGNGLITAIDA